MLVAAVYLRSCNRHATPALFRSAPYAPGLLQRALMQATFAVGKSRSLLRPRDANTAVYQGVLHRGLNSPEWRLLDGRTGGGLEASE
jgi:hypothetical protein